MTKQQIKELIAKHLEEAHTSLVDNEIYCGADAISTATARAVWCELDEIYGEIVEDESDE